MASFQARIFDAGLVKYIITYLQLYVLVDIYICIDTYVLLSYVV